MLKKILYCTQTIDDLDIAEVISVLKSDFLSQGPKIEGFEKKILNYTGAKFCVAVSSGTAALHLAVAVLNIKRGYEGITSPITFMASANCFLYNGLKPEFADINPQTYCISVDKIERKINHKTRLVIPVHFAGQPADMKKISHLANKFALNVIEDAAHALGSKYEDGKMVGSCQYSDMTIFSFQPLKNITTGEGGAITTNQKELYEKLLMLRNHGITKKKELFLNPGKGEIGPWYHEMQALGFNYRITDFQAALGVSQLQKLCKFIKSRRQIVERYNSAFKDLKWLTIPHEKPGVFSAFHLYVVKINYQLLGKDRSKVMMELKKKEIYTQVHYIPVHLQPFYRNNFGFKPGDFPESEKYYRECLSLPLYPKLGDQDVKRVIMAVYDLGN